MIVFTDSEVFLVAIYDLVQVIKQYLENRFKCVIATCVAPALLAALGAPSGGGGG